MTWEKFLVLWGLIAPGVGAVLAHLWSATQAKAARTYEDQKWERQVALDEDRKTRDEEREVANRLQVRMGDAYGQFLTCGSVLTNLPESFFTTPAEQEALREFSAAYQQLLLIASTACAAPAVNLWHATLKLVNESPTREERQKTRESIKKLRAKFVIEARLDLENSVERNANAGIRIEPALKVGGFHLEDVG